MKIDEAALKAAYVRLQSEIGSLDGLSQEVANTTVNIYYGFYNFTKNMLSLAAKTSDANQLNRDAAFYMSAIKFIGQQTRHLRNAIDQTDAQTYKHLENFFLDSFKYRLDKVSEKSFARRAIERKFTKAKEIPNILEIMREHGYRI